MLRVPTLGGGILDVERSFTCSCKRANQPLRCDVVMSERGSMIQACQVDRASIEQRMAAHGRATHDSRTDPFPEACKQTHMNACKRDDTIVLPQTHHIVSHETS